MKRMSNLVWALLAALLIAMAPVLTSQAAENTAGGAGNAAGHGGAVTRAEFLSVIIKETGLNLDDVRFIKAPDVRDVAADVSPESPYAWDIITAGHYGVVENRKPFRPQDPVLREEAASMAVRALNAKLSVPVNDHYIIFEDAGHISPGSGEYVQIACKIGLFRVEKRFRPGDALTRAEFSALLLSLKKVMNRGEVQDGVTWKISEDGKRITLYWGEKPTGGYAIHIESLHVEGGVLKVVYRLRSPGPGEAVTQAITYPEARADLPESSGPFAGVVLIKAGAGAQPERIVFGIGRNEYITGYGKMSMDAAAFLENGRAYVPVRFMAQSLGVAEERVAWSPSARTVNIFKDGINLFFAVGGNVLYINGRPLKMDAAPVLRDGRTYLPARYMAEALGCSVEWDEGEQAVIITPGRL